MSSSQGKTTARASDQQAVWVCKGLHFLRSLVRRRSRDNAKRMPETIAKLHPFAWAGLRHASRIALPIHLRCHCTQDSALAFSHSWWKLLDQIPHRLTIIHSVTLFRGQPQNSRCCQRPVCTIPWRDLRPTLAGCVPVPLAPNLVHCSPDGVSLGCGECTEISDIRSLVANTHLCTSIVQ